jgi:hypothetical protein
MYQFAFRTSFCTEPRFDLEKFYSKPYFYMDTCNNIREATLFGISHDHLITTLSHAYGPGCWGFSQMLLWKSENAPCFA